MLQILFFARLREQLDCAVIELPFSVETATLDALCESLCRERGESWADALGQANIICAVNQVVVNGNADLHDGDEVAFFPPVTGG